MRIKRPVGCVLLALAGAIPAGCGGGQRKRLRSAPSRQAAALARAAATHEYPSPSPPPEHAPGAGTPVAAIAQFTRRYINWNAHDVSAQMSALARVSVGQARSEMVLAAAQTKKDSTLQQGDVANRGAVEAVARLRGRPGEYVVVTRESTVAGATAAYQGLAPAWHLTLVSVQAQRRAGGERWVISGWQPQS